MTPEQAALYLIEKYPVDSWERDTIIHCLGEYLDRAYAIIGTNVARKIRLARIAECRDWLRVALVDIGSGREVTR